MHDAPPADCPRTPPPSRVRMRFLPGVNRRLDTGNSSTLGLSVMGVRKWEAVTAGIVLPLKVDLGGGDKRPNAGSGKE